MDILLFKTNDNLSSKKNYIRLKKSFRKLCDTSKNMLLFLNKEYLFPVEIKKSYKKDHKIINELYNKYNCVIGTVSNSFFDKFEHKIKEKIIFNNISIYKFSLYNESDLVSVGADPEFLLYKDNILVHANSISYLTKHTPLGSDGPMAEIRPKFTYSADMLINNISAILNSEEAQRLQETMVFKPACYVKILNKRDYPVGGHLHFGIKTIYNYLSEINNLKYLNYYRTHFIACLSKIFDEILTVPLIRLDGKKGYYRRSKCYMSSTNNYNLSTPGLGYGYFGEYRYNPLTFEYRSLSGYILGNKRVFKSIINIGKHITYLATKYVINNINEFKQNCDKYQFKQENVLAGKDELYCSFTQWDKINLANYFKTLQNSSTLQKLINESDLSIVTPKYITRWGNNLLKNKDMHTIAQDIEFLAEFLSDSHANIRNKISTPLNTWGNQ